MAGRQRHKKSRRGCLGCKRRHLKCDEQGPPCVNCRVRNLECNYVPVTEPTSNIQEQTPDSASFASLDARRCELQLFHQWSIDTYRSLVFQSSDENLWQVTIPRTALDQPYLLNVILALSSLHISTSTISSQSKSFQFTALEYHNSASTAFQAEERHATLESHQTLFAFSIINLVFVVALPSCLHTDIDQSTSIDNLSTMFSLLQGTTHIHQLSKTWLLDGPFGNYVRSNGSMQTEELDPDSAASFKKLRLLRDEEYVAFSAASESASEAVRTYEICSKTIEDLEVCFRLRSKDKMVVCFRWLALLEQSFLQRISRREPLALLITMHWAVLLDRLGQEKWWAKSSGKTIVAEASKLLSATKPEWLSIMSWVHRQVGLPPLVII